MKKEDIARINELAHKAKTVGLTPEENEGIRKVPHFSQKIIDDNVIKNDVLQQRNERIMERKRRIWFPGEVYHLMNLTLEHWYLTREKNNRKNLYYFMQNP